MPVRKCKRRRKSAYLHGLVDELDDISYSEEFWIVTGPEVRHYHQPQTRFKWVRKDLMYPNAVVPRVTNGGEK